MSRTLRSSEPHHRRRSITGSSAPSRRHEPIAGQRKLHYFTTEIGPLNQIIHMWGYDSFEERSKRRAQMQADPGWKAYVAKVQPLLHTQETKILNPTSFSPIR